MIKVGWIARHESLLLIETGESFVALRGGRQAIDECTNSFAVFVAFCITFLRFHLMT